MVSFFNGQSYLYVKGDISGAKIANMSLSDTGCHTKTDILTYILSTMPLAHL